MRKSSVFRLILLAALCAGAWMAYTQQAAQPINIEKVRDDLYVLIGDGGNVAIFITDEGVILVDDKFERDYEQIMAHVKGVTESR
jgi:cyclase